nr:phosphoribosyltransferase family protein [uncultured Flavobacterium sp.]
MAVWYNELLNDRKEAGILLSERLKKYQNSNTIILAVPRGGVPVGYEIAKRLHLPMDIVLSKKIGHPNNKEYAIGAVSMNSMTLKEHPEVPQRYIEDEVIRLRKLLKEKYELYMGNREPIDIQGKNVIVVDDGIATGNTLIASISMLRKKEPAKIIVAVPVLPADVIPVFQRNADEFVYLIVAKYFRGVGGFYEQFDQVEDEEVIRMLGVPSAIQ